MTRKFKAYTIRPGEKYNKLTLIGISHRDKHAHLFCKYICECGREAVIRHEHVLNGATKSCGCIQQRYIRQLEQLGLIKEGEYLNLRDVCADMGLNYDCVQARLNNMHWNILQALELEPSPSQLKSDKTIEFNGESLTISQWAERTGICKKTLKSRLAYGWGRARTLTTPVGSRKNQTD